MATQKNSGWSLLVFEDEIVSEVASVEMTGRRLAIAKVRDQWRVMEASCPHRGAHLGHGGRVNGDCIICPFHQHAISVGASNSSVFSTTEYETLSVGTAILAKFLKRRDCGFRDFVESLNHAHFIVPAFRMNPHTVPQIVIENGFDNAHFNSVHGIRSRTDSFGVNEQGAFVAKGILIVKPSGSSNIQELHAPYTLTAYSPLLSVLQVYGSGPYTLIVGAVPATSGCILRVVLGLPKATYGHQPNAGVVQHLIRESKAGIEDDKRIWDHLDVSMIPHFTDNDCVVRAFQEFCRTFDESSEVD